MGRFRTSLTLVTAIIAGSFITTNNALAAPDDCGTNTYFDWNCGGQGIVGLLITIVNWLAIGVAIAVVGGIIYGAILYTSSGGNPEQSKKGIDTIRNAIIALILYFAMWALINFLVPGGLFNTP